MAGDPVPHLPPLLEAVLGVGSALELHTTLQRIVDGAAELTGARYAALSTTDPGQDGLTEIRTATHPPEDDDGRDVPILVGGEPYGRLHLAGRRGGDPFTDEDEQLLRVLATQAGIAIGNARLYEAARQRERWIEGAATVTTALLTGRAPRTR
jgi:transcriptional regulator with GAF, ATPase, and Fis domain